MIFETLHESAERRELLLWDGAMCHYHLRRDGQLTIREVIVLPERQESGLGRAIVRFLMRTGATSLFAKCPADLAANGWYQHLGFMDEGTETTKTGRTLRLWRLRL